MKKQFNNLFNPYFMLPFLLWIVLGAFFLFLYDSQTLFQTINSRHSVFLDQIMVICNKLGEGWIIGLVALLFYLLRPFRTKSVLISGLLCTTIPAIVAQFIKYNVVAPRPMNRFDGQSWIHFIDSWDLLHNNSFPSGHTTGAFSLFVFIACLLPSKHRIWGLLFFGLALSVAYARVYLAAHFFVDVYVGSIIGTFISYLILILVFRFKEKNGRQIG